MKRGGAMPTNRPTGRVYMNTDCTIRWRRGDREAYVLRGNTVGSWTMEGLLGKVPVSPAGWADLAEVRLIGQKWVRSVRST